MCGAVPRHVRWSVAAYLAQAVLLAVVVLGRAASASAAPLRATFKPVPSLSITRPIRAAKGGTLTLMAPGRVQIIVRIPRGALLSDTTITATPVTRFRVGPVHGGFVAGVQLAPEGLKLLRPGSVEFRPRKGLRATRRFFLGSQGNGSDVYLTPPAFRKVGRGRNAKLRVVSTPIVPILHFSTVEGFDWSKTNLGDLSDIRYPQSAIARVAHELAKQLADERQRQLTGFELEVRLADMEEVMARMRDHVIKPHLQVVTQALTSRCSPQALANAQGALALALGFVRQEELLGLPVSFDTAELMGPILKKTATCMLKLCSRYGPRLALPLMGTERQVELLGAPARDAFFSALLRNLVACSKGEVHLDSTINKDVVDDFGGVPITVHRTMRVVGRAPFQATPDGRGWIYPEAALNYQDAHGSELILDQSEETSCGPGPIVWYRDSLGVNSNGALRISQLDFSPLDPAKPDTSPPIEKLILTITQDPTERETVSADCASVGPTDGATPHLWVDFFGENHPPLRAPVFNGPHFIAEGAPVIALAVYPGPMDPVPDRTLSENTLVEVLSTPGPLEPMPDPFTGE